MRISCQFPFFSASRVASDDRIDGLDAVLAGRETTDEAPEATLEGGAIGELAAQPDTTAEADGVGGVEDVPSCFGGRQKSSPHNTIACSRNGPLQSATTSSAVFTVRPFAFSFASDGALIASHAKAAAVATCLILIIIY
jgi:hypothetical protein